MNLDNILNARCSVRAYADRKVAPTDLHAIVTAAQKAPSACNSQTWRFVVVTEKEMIGRITKKAMRAVISNRWLAQAPALIVGCSQLDLVANRIGARVTGIEYYQIDLGIAMEHMVLKATELGLGTCWIGWFKEEALKTLLDIPPKVKISALLAIGYAKDPSSTKKVRKPVEKIAFAQRWGNRFS
jgi:nitroreductase